MLYSVRRHDGRYDYYRSEVEKPSVPSGPMAGLGMAVEESLPQLPVDSVQEGSGERARGVLCQPSGAAGGRGALFWIIAIGAGLWFVSDMYQFGKAVKG